MQAAAQDPTTLAALYVRAAEDTRETVAGMACGIDSLLAAVTELHELADPLPGEVQIAPAPELLEALAYLRRVHAALAPLIDAAGVTVPVTPDPPEAA